MDDRHGETLEGLPRIELEVVDDHTAKMGSGEGFLRVRRLSLRNRYADGTASAVYRYDMIERDAMDAVGIVLFARGAGGVEDARVCLRSSLRPPLHFRPGQHIPLPDAGDPVQWEIPAGLIEPDEQGEEGVRACAARETLEEVGLVTPPEAFRRLGPQVALTPGAFGEKIHFMVAEVDPDARSVPEHDGPVEERAEVRFVALSSAIEATRDGRVVDAKTEVGLRRLAEMLDREAP